MDRLSQPTTCAGRGKPHLALFKTATHSTKSSSSRPTPPMTVAIFTRSEHFGIEISFGRSGARAQQIITSIHRKQSQRATVSTVSSVIDASS